MRWPTLHPALPCLGRWPAGARPAEGSNAGRGRSAECLDARPAQRPVGRSAAAEPPLAPFALAKPDLRAHWRCARALLHTWRRRARGGRVVRPAWPQTGCLPEVSSSLARSSLLLHLLRPLEGPAARLAPPPSNLAAKGRKGLGRASLLVRSGDKDRVRQDSVRREEVARTENSRAPRGGALRQIALGASSLSLLLPTPHAAAPSCGRTGGAAAAGDRGVMPSCAAVSAVRLRTSTAVSRPAASCGCAACGACTSVPAQKAKRSCHAPPSRRKHRQRACRARGKKCLDACPWRYTTHDGEQHIRHGHGFVSTTCDEAEGGIRNRTPLR